MLDDTQPPTGARRVQRATIVDPDRILAALIRLEQTRQPLTDRAGLAVLLAQVASELRALTGAPAARITVNAAAYDPPLAIDVGDGALNDAAGALAIRSHEVHWNGMHLATITLATPRPVEWVDAALALLVRGVTESAAEVWAAEHLARETADRTRRELAHELHADVKQVLPAIRMLAERAERELQRDLACAAGLLREIREAAQQALDELTFLLDELRDQDLASDLNQAIERLLASVARAAPALRIERSIELPPMSGEVAACVLGVVRNAIANVLQHAQAGMVQLQIVPHDAGVLVQIRDDGMGEDPQAALAAPGMGLESMRERATRLGGTFQLMSAPGAGTCVSVWLPLGAREIGNG